MQAEEYNMHIRAGRYYGQLPTCGKKIDYKSEGSAANAAHKLSVKNERNLEAYPCAFCNGWHIGRAMTPREREIFSSDERAENMGNMETIHINATEAFLGCQLGVIPLKVHNRSICAGEYCSIHNPSDHPLRTFQLNWRADLRVMERLCDHGIGHPDPDDEMFRSKIQGKRFRGSVHGCDGCCSTKKKDND